MSAVMALLLPGIALAAGESKEAAQRAKFLAEHPAVAKIIPASEANIIPPRMLVQTEALKTPVYNPDGGVLPEIWTNIIASKAWTGRYTGYGIYNFAPQTPITLENIAKGESDFMKGNGGGVLINGLYYLINWEVSIGGIVTTYTVYDTATWEKLNSTRTEPRFIATDLAYDRINKVCYGAVFNDNLSGYELAKMKYTTNSPSKTTIGSLPLMAVALGVDSKGDLYGIMEDCVLYKINKTDASLTPIGDTGIRVAGQRGIVQMSGEFDQHTDIFYFAANDVYGNYALYTVDTSTGEASKIADIPDSSQLLNLQIMTPKAEDKAPGYLRDFSVSFPDGSLSGEVSFSIPQKTYDGSELSSVTYNISVNSSVKATASAAAGEKVQIPLNLPQGSALIKAWAVNDAGSSPTEAKTLWIGQDYPRILSVTYTARSLESSVTWKPDTVGTHAGYVGQLKYDVIRMPGNHEVAKGITATSFSETLPQDAPMANYYYTVIPRNGDLIGEGVNSNSNTVGSAVSLPYENHFDAPDSFDLLTIVDSNRDGYSWFWGEESWAKPQGVATCDGWVMTDEGDSYNVEADDWLLTPELHVEAGTTYQVAFKGRSTSYSTDNDRLSVAYGAGTNVENYITILPPSELPFNFGDEMTCTFTSDKDQNIRIGFHRTMPPSNASMQLDDIRISSMGTNSAPESVSDLNVIPAEKGRLRATVKFKAPMTTKEGKPLTGLTKTEIYVDDKLAETIENPTPGSDIQREVKVSGNGWHNFRVDIFSESGQGQSAICKPFVGVDIPGSVECTLTDCIDHIQVKWTTPEGANGQYVDPDKITYDIYQSDGYQIVAEIAVGYSGTEMDIPFDTTEGEQGGVLLAIRANNAAGSGTLRHSNALIVGEPYRLPYEEHFNGTTQYMYDQGDCTAFGPAQGASSDGDNASFGWVAVYDRDTEHTVKSMKIATAGSKNLHLIFDHSVEGSDYIEVYAIHRDGSESILGTCRKTDGDRWQTASYSLADVVNDTYFRFKFRFVKGDDGGFDFIDNLRVIDASDHDLAATISLPPSSVKHGQTADINVIVTNKGLNTSGDYSVSLFNGDNCLGTMNGTGLEISKSEIFRFQYNVGVGAPSEITLRAVVEYEQEQNPEDNSDKAVLHIQDQKVSAPENLSGEENSGISLRWDTPTEFYSEEVTDDFESYPAWTITNMGDWKLVDLDNASTVGFEEATYPNCKARMAYIIYNPYELGMPQEATIARPFSGMQCAVSFAADINSVEHNDDWLISPLLPGRQQDIEFYAKAILPDYGPEKFQILYSTTGNNPEDFILLKEQEIDNYLNWGRIQASLPEGSLYFAIRCITADGYMFMVDDVNYTRGSCTEITDFNIYRNSQKIGTVKYPQTTFHDAEGNGTDVYNVTAVYATGEESGFSNPFSTVGLEVIIDDNFAPADIYGIDGTIVRHNATTIKGLRPGVYIMNHRKFMVE